MCPMLVFQIRDPHPGHKQPPLPKHFRTAFVCLLTPALVHAPGLRPDFERVRLLLEGSIGSWLQWGQAGERLGGGRGHWGRSCQRLVGHRGYATGRRVSVGAPVTAHTVLRTALTVLPLQLL